MTRNIPVTDTDPASLRTPTDIKVADARAICDALNHIVADGILLYLKTKNFHWHMTGPHFRDYHILLDEQADQIFAAIDPLAERVRKLGHSTVRSISHVSKLSTLRDNNEPFVSPFDMLCELVEDNKKVAAAMRAAHGVCDDAKDIATASLLEIYVDETERRTWFLFEASRGADSSGH